MGAPCVSVGEAQDRTEDVSNAVACGLGWSAERFARDQSNSIWVSKNICNHAETQQRHSDHAQPTNQLEAHTERSAFCEPDSSIHRLIDSTVIERTS
jgi:hypothetical protein